MFRKLLSTYPKYTVHSPQYKVWATLEKDKNIEYRACVEKKPTKSKIPSPKEVNERIDNRDEYDDNPREWGEVDEKDTAFKGKPKENIAIGI